MTVVDIIIKLIIPLLAAMVTYYVIPLLKKKNLYDTVKTGVLSAESVFRSSGMGKQKFEYVKSWVAGKFNIENEDLEKIIESIVFEMNNAIK